MSTVRLLTVALLAALLGGVCRAEYESRNTDVHAHANVYTHTRSGDAESVDAADTSERDLDWSVFEGVQLADDAGIGSQGAGLVEQQQEEKAEKGEEEDARRTYIRGRRSLGSHRLRGDDDSDETQDFHVPKEETPKDKFDNSGTRRVIVTYENEKGHKNALMKAEKVVKEHRRGHKIEMDCTGNCLQDIESQEGVASVRYDFPIEAASADFPHGSFDRTLIEYVPWGLKATQMSSLNVGPQKPGIMICVADTGIALGHPDFNSDLITGTDTVKPDGTVWRWNEDHSGHGTHVAGTIAALAGNDIGVQGAGNFRLHIVRALDDRGMGLESDAINAMEQCMNAGADIINLSLGGPYISKDAYDFIESVVHEKGIMVVAAAGNFGVSELFYPASHPDVISVAASYNWGHAVEWSNWGIQIELSAPGYDILSTTVSTSAVQTSDHGFPAFPLPDVPTHAATGKLIDCSRGEYTCTGAVNGICMMARGKRKVEDMVKNCVRGGGIGAVIYSDVFSPEEDDKQKLWKCRKCDIPVVRVKSVVGNEIRRTAMSTTVTVGDAFSDEQEYTYDFLSGTSMAAPHVAAAAGLVWSHTYDTCTNQQVRYALARTAIDLPIRRGPNDGLLDKRTDDPFETCDLSHGYGMVRAASALRWLQDIDCTEWEIESSMRGGCCIIEPSSTSRFRAPSYCSE